MILSKIRRRILLKVFQFCRKQLYKKALETPDIVVSSSNDVHVLKYRSYHNLDVIQRSVIDFHKMGLGGLNVEISVDGNPPLKTDRPLTIKDIENQVREHHFHKMCKEAGGHIARIEVKENIYGVEGLFVESTFVKKK